jgi:hypothetical protein
MDALVLQRPICCVVGMNGDKFIIAGHGGAVIVGTSAFWNPLARRKVGSSSRLGMVEWPRLHLAAPG